MAVIAEVSIGPLENADGTKMVYPVSLRMINFWVSWSEDPEDDFDLSSYRQWNPSAPDARQIHFEQLRSGSWQAYTHSSYSLSFLKRIGNQFQFRMTFAGLEHYCRIRVVANIHSGNSESTLEFPALTYAPVIGSITVPSVSSGVIKERDIKFIASSRRGRNTAFFKDSFTLEGIVNSNYYTSKDVIESIEQPFSYPNGVGFVASSNRDVIVNVKLPAESEGIVRLRIERNSVRTFTGSFPEALRYDVLAAKGPAREPFLSDFIRFNTKHDPADIANTPRQIRLTRGAEGTTSSIHAENSQIIQIDQVIDVRDNKWVIKPLDELSWRSDTNSLYNQIRIFYGNNNEYYQEDPQSVFENGGNEFSMNVPLADHQSHWVRQIAQNMLNSFAKLQHIVTLQLKLSLHIKLGHIIYLRGLATDAINNVVQVVGVEHFIGDQYSVVTVRTINRPAPQTLSPPVFLLRLFTSGETINLIVGSTYTAQLVATGNPSPTITVTGNPSWLTVDAQGNITARPTATGTSTVTFTASNGQSPDAAFTLIFTATHSNRWNSAVWNRFKWGT